ncbi:MAG TPA: TonB-dependent receptor [Gemmatimonadaceae bacterium]|nr:TonB-dependent receptor [Gemmatimonadaceae bacterium]
MTFLFSVAAAALIGLSSAPAAVVEAPMATSALTILGDSIRGRVADSTGKPLVSAKVTLVELGRVASTDANGAFVLANVPAGRYTVVARRLGYSSASRVVSVADGERAVVELRLPMIMGDLEPVVVTATRDAIDVRQSPLPVSELAGDRLHREQSVSLASAIDRLPGVHGLTTGQQIGKPVIRGLSGSRVLVLDNGHRLEDYSWSDEDGPSVAARLAQRVEVIRGPASVLYGSDAIGGVVNVIPAALPDATAGRFTRTMAELSGASNNREAGVLLGAEGARSRIGWRATGIARLAEDLTTPDGKLENTKFSSVSGDAALGLHSSRGTSAVRYARYGGEFRLLEANEPPRPPGAEEEEEGPERKLSDDRVQFTGNYMLPKFRLEPKLQWQRHQLAEMSDELGPGGAPTGVETEVFNLLLNTLSADVLAHHAVGRMHGTLGVTGEYQTSDSRGLIPLVPDARVTSVGAFGFEQVDVGSLSIVAGLRGDSRSLSSDANADLGLNDQSRHASALSGDIGVVLHPTTDLAMTANVGRAWRAPTLFELFANGPRLGEARYEIGDATLDPETSLNLDGSLRWSAHRVRAEVAGFRNRINDFIYVAPTGQQQGNLQVYRYQHALATLTGGELSADVDATNLLTLRGRYDFVKGTNEDADVPLPLIPPHRTTLEADVHSATLGWAEQAYAGVDVEITSEQTRLGQFDTPTDGYTLLGLDAGIARHIGSHPFRLDVRVRNLTDKRYASFLSRYKAFAPDPGRNILVRLSTEF